MPFLENEGRAEPMNLRSSLAAFCCCLGLILIQAQLHPVAPPYTSAPHLIPVPELLSRSSQQKGLNVSVDNEKSHYRGVQVSWCWDWSTVLRAEASSQCQEATGVSVALGLSELFFL